MATEILQVLLMDSVPTSSWVMRPRRSPSATVAGFQWPTVSVLPPQFLTRVMPLAWTAWGSPDS